MLSKKLLGTLVVIAAAFAVPGSAAASGPDPGVPALEHRLVLRSAVTVGVDGNGATSASFDGITGASVRYMLVVENGCRSTATTLPCPSPVNTLSVTLNGQVVFQAENTFENRHVRLPADAVLAGTVNRLTITAAGTPRSAARIRILATPDFAPAPAFEHRLMLRSAVKVGVDGNGATSASFDGITGASVRYMLVVENGCRSTATTLPCPSPVNTLSVTLNGQVVFQAENTFENRHVRLPTHAVLAGAVNRLTITAAGTPRSAARIRILATPDFAPAPAFEHRLMLRSAVKVGVDGNGATSASFDGITGASVRYMLVVENGCRSTATTLPCPSPVNTLSVTLNGQVVFQAENTFENRHVRLPTHAVLAGAVNRLTITAAGTPRSAARIRILATPRRANTR